MNINDIEVLIPKEILDEINRAATPNRCGVSDTEIIDVYHLEDVNNSYSIIVECGVKAFDRKLTYNEILFMQASLCGTGFMRTDVKNIVRCFINNIEDLGIHEPFYALEFDVNGMELANKLLKEPVINCYLLLIFLRGLPSGFMSNTEYKENIEKYLKLKE